MTIIHKGRRNSYFTLTTLRELGVNKVLEEIIKVDDYSWKKFEEPVRWMLDAIRVTYKDPTIYFEVRSTDNIGVLQAGMRMGAIGTFQPSGNTRDTIQAQVCSDKIKNKKSPVDVKRSSTRAKAEKLIDLLGYRDHHEYAKRQFDQTSYDFNNIVRKSAPVQDKPLNDFAGNLYYNNGFDFLARLMRGQVHGTDQAEVEKYLQAYDKMVDQRMEQELLKLVYVILQTLPPGGPSAYRMLTSVLDSSSPIPETYITSIRDFPSIEALPDVVQSKLALLQLGSGQSANMVGFHNEADCDWLRRYCLIGEDLGELLDTGRESKEGGNSLSE
jgi:hypothetical protein